MNRNNQDIEASKNGSVIIVSAWIGLATLTFYLLFVGQSIFLPLVLSIYITYLIKALSNALGRLRIIDRKLPDSANLGISIIFIIAIIVLLVQLVAENIKDIASSVHIYQERLHILTEDIGQKLFDWIGTYLTIGQLNEQFNFQSAVLNLIVALQSIAGSTFQILLYVAFLLLESTTLNLKISALSNTKEQEDKIKNILKAIGNNIEKYILIKTVMSLLVSTLSYTVLIIFGIDFAAFWALIIFILNYIPYIGSLIGVAFPVIMSVLQFYSISLTIVLLIGLMLCQIIVGNLIEPKLTGKTLNLSPVVILLALSIWGSIWGVSGMILSVPIMVMIMIILSEFKSTRPLAILMSQSGKII